MGFKINNKEDKTYIVMGTPYSATSFISKALEDQGVDMGNNMNGLYQNHDFWSVNQRLLKAAGGSWVDIPDESKILEKVRPSRMKQKIKKYKSKLWGFKDPRTSLTAKAYFPYLDGDVYLICCFRKPDKVVESESNKSDKNFGREVVDEYNRRIISNIKEFVGLE